jgi:protein-S-isoprenylcysteine O-methyltransferase Ste14
MHTTVMITPLGWLLLVALSAVVIAASLTAWRTHQTHGTFRFLGLECLAVLIAWNAGRWFRDPLSIRQLASWALFVGATLLALHGVHLLRSVGRAQRRVMEETQTLVEAGVYGYIRHPLYLSLMLFGWGVALKGLDPVSLGLAVAATFMLVATARYEERFNIEHFGAAYSEYMKRTRMFIPWLL